MERLPTVLRQRLEETQLAAEIPALSVGQQNEAYVYYVCPHKMKSNFFPEPLAFAKVSLPSAPFDASLRFYRNAASTFFKPLGSFTLYYYNVDDAPTVSIPDRMEKVGESWEDRPDGCFMLIVKKDSPFSSHLEAAQKAFMKKACVLEDDPDRDNRLAARQREKAEASQAARLQSFQSFKAEQAAQKAEQAAQKAERRAAAKHKLELILKTIDISGQQLLNLMQEDSLVLEEFVAGKILVLSSETAIEKTIDDMFTSLEQADYDDRSVWRNFLKLYSALHDVFTAMTTTREINERHLSYIRKWYNYLKDEVPRRRDDD